MRRHIKTDAIILGTLDYGESDRIVTFYSREYGKLSGIAKGARRSKKRFVGNLDPPSHTKLLVFKDDRRDLARIDDGTLIEGFHGIKGDIDRFAEACYMIELLRELTPEGLHIDGLFETTVCFLQFLQASDRPELTLRFFEIKLLTLLGYMPHLSGCVGCDDDDDVTANGQGIFFSAESGGLLCNPCGRGSSDATSLASGTAGFLSMASRLSIDKLPRLQPSAVFAREGERVLSDFIRHRVGRELKTKKFMEKMRVAANA